MKIELFFIDIMKGKKKGVFPSVMRGILTLLSLPYRFVIFCRNWGYNNRLLKQYTPPVPLVISIGNITAGGTGKTPFIIKLASEFEQPSQIAILSRGYRSLASKESIPFELKSGQPPSICGDEPYLISENLKGVHVFVGKNREKASKLAAASGAKLILLDDGMQHRQLARDVEVVVMDSNDPFGGGHHLPRGFLRESPKSLARAHLIIINHVSDSLTYFALKEQLKRYSNAPVVGAAFKVDEILNLQNEKIQSIEGKRVGLFCGIANPDYFRETVTSLQAEIVVEEKFSDHETFDEEGMALFAKKAFSQGAELLICTEKDKVKLSPGLKLSLPIVWVKMKIEIVQDLPVWNTFVNHCKTFV